MLKEMVPQERRGHAVSVLHAVKMCTSTSRRQSNRGTDAVPSYLRHRHACQFGVCIHFVLPPLFPFLRLFGLVLILSPPVREQALAPGRCGPQLDLRAARCARERRIEHRLSIVRGRWISYDALRPLRQVAFDVPPVLYSSTTGIENRRNIKGNNTVNNGTF